MAPKYIFVTGGVVSSLGKGVAAASIGCLLESRGLKVTLQKCDPYLNVDPGTMSPFQHGEVFVTDDGAETDLDLGHYERFTHAKLTRDNNWTTGRIYETDSRQRAARRLSRQNRAGHPARHRRNQSRDQQSFRWRGRGDRRNRRHGRRHRVACRFSKRSGRCAWSWAPKTRLFVHVTLVPFIAAAGELKTKPTQHSVKEMLGIGIQPDILLCRSDRHIPDDLKKKIALFCNVAESCVISMQDVDTIYAVPVALAQRRDWTSRFCAC